MGLGQARHFTNYHRVLNVPIRPGTRLLSAGVLALLTVSDRG